jgi:type IV pilus assembly protein PilB
MKGADDADRSLEDLKAREEEELAQILSGKYGIGYIDLTRLSINSDALRLIPEERARAAECAAYDVVGKRISLAVRSPQGDKLPGVIADLEKNNYEVIEFMTSRASLARAWERYKDLSFATGSKEGVFDISSVELEKTMRGFTKVTDVVMALNEVAGLKKAYRISRILEVILGGALAMDASDVHIEPEQEDVRLRYRVDGVLSDVSRIDQETYGLVLSRLKLLSGLKLNIHDRPQDGRFSIMVAGSEMEVRTSVIPEAYGETIVMRLLNPKSIGTSLENLGMEEALRVIVEHEITKANGMLLTTGPTGSGKTTALYAAMKKMYTPGMKIITIEDPIEYHLAGIVQTQVSPEYTFIGGLRSALRQDPDVIMVGEIRDAEVARTAIDAALTGHFVFSTLHTNDAAGSFPRLADFGIDLKVVGSAMTVVLAQRLVRKLCVQCKKEVKIEGAIKEKIDNGLARVKKLKPAMIPATDHIYAPFGCDVCNGTGYAGRIGIFEGIQVDKEIDQLVRDNPSERDIKEVQKKRPLLLIYEDGLIKVLAGITSMDELERVVNVEES